MILEGEKLKSVNSRDQVNPNGTLSDEISKLILGDIISGKYLVGSKLPTERMLSGQFGVARQVVRESLKHLEALGAVTIRKRSGILVNELPISCFFKHYELFLFKTDGSIDIDCLKEILHFRLGVNIQVVRDAARNRTTEDLKELRDISHEFRETREDQDRLIDLMTSYMRTLAKASHNRIYQMLTHTVIDLIFRMERLLLQDKVLTHESDEAMEQLLSAIENQDEEIAVILAERRFKEVDRRIIQEVKRGAS